MERIHRTQMSAAEIVYTESLVHAIMSWDFSHDHVMDRMVEKKIAKNDIVNTLKYGDVIEVNSLGRVILRLMKGKMKGTCAVVSIRDRRLVTTWYNDPRDNHKTLDKSEYEWRVDVIKFLEEQHVR